MHFVWLAHTSPGSFTIQLRVPVYIPKNKPSYIEHNTPTDLCLQNTQRNILQGICDVLRPTVIAKYY